MEINQHRRELHGHQQHAEQRDAEQNGDARPRDSLPDDFGVFHRLAAHQNAHQRGAADHHHHAENQELPDQRDAAQRDQLRGVLPEAAEQVRQFQLFAVFQRAATGHQADQHHRQQQAGERFTDHRHGG